MPDDVREEAERLVAAALAAVSFALRNADRAGSLAGMAERFLGGDPFGPHLATFGSAGSRTAESEPAPPTPECCICPVCRGIAALRNPSPEFAARVASGASDVAAGLTSILRAFGAANTAPDTDAAPDTDIPPRPRPPSSSGATWRAATDGADWATDGADWSEPVAGDDPDDRDPWHAATTATPPPRKMAKKAVRKAPPPEDEPRA
jgi:hypothetical protein